MAEGYAAIRLNGYPATHPLNSPPRHQENPLFSHREISSTQAILNAHTDTSQAGSKTLKIPLCVLGVFVV